MLFAVYWLQFPDGAFYIGATRHLATRLRFHRKGFLGAISRYIRKTGLDFTVHVLYDRLTRDKARKLEIQLIGLLKPTLNTHKGGTLGCYQPATFRECLDSARRFETRNAWQRSSDHRFYIAAAKAGWRERCCAHMRNALRKYTLEHCLETARQFKTPHDWYRAHPGAYLSSLHSGWAERCTKHMAPFRRQTHTLARCVKSASKYRDATRWFAGDSRAYRAAHRHGWLKACKKAYGTGI